MRDLIIGVLLGAMMVTLMVYHFSLRERIVKIEVRQERICQDVDRIALKVGPLPERRR